MKNAVVLLFALFTATAASAADEMQKLAFLQGEWKGEAWIQMGPGKPEYVIQTERVTPKAGGKALLIEGLGKRKLPDGTAGEIVHDALAVISWNEEKKTYRFDAYVANKPRVDATLDVTAPNTAVWGFSTPQGGKIRYTINLTEKGEWREIGEFTRDGATWMKFFEMTLQKMK
jgi:hypothetical protein